MKNSKYIPLLLVILLSFIVFASGCHRSKTPGAKRYHFTGKVISVDTQAETALINNDDIPGFMEPMAMSYKFKPASQLHGIEPGDTIAGDVVVIEPDPKNPDAASDYWLENVKVTAHAAQPPAKGPNAMHMPAPGEDVPDFAFTNQDGKRVTIKDYRGKTLLVTFIYTRCPFPDFCPRMSGNFNEIYQQTVSDASLKDLRLLSVSFDPEYDTPKVLREYAYSVAHTKDAALFRRWTFAAAPKDELPKIADFFALTVQPEGSLITHNLSTAVIGPDSKIVKWYHGGDWQVSDVIKDAAGAQKS